MKTRNRLRFLILAAFALAVPVPAGAQITVNATGSATVAGIQNSYTLSASFDASGSDKLVVTVSMERDRADENTSIASVTYNGTPLIKAVQSKAYGEGPAAIFYLDHPGPAGPIIATGSAIMNGAHGSWLALFGTAEGVGPTNATVGRSTSITTAVFNSLVVAHNHVDGGTVPVAQAPLTALLSSNGQYSEAADGYQFVIVPGTVTATFSAGTIPVTVAAVFNPLRNPGGGPEMTLVAMSPADDATDVWVPSPLVATFSKPVAPGIGNITLKNLTDSINTVIPLGDPRISVSGYVLTIDAGSLLKWNKAYAVQIDPIAIDSVSGVSFAGISDDTTWNFTTLPGDPLLLAIADLKDHTTGVMTLSAARIDAHKQTIDAEKDRFAESAATISAVFDLVKTYDSVKGPLWIARGQFDRDKQTNDLDWTIYHVMQYIMDEVYTAETIAKHEVLLAGFKFGSSANFPGACSPPANPDQTHTATINGNYLDTWGWPTMHEERPARKPTGTYLAPGSIATVTVPPSLVGRGYQIRVGCHSWDFSVKPTIKRLDRVSLVYAINATETRVANPLGGGIYIEVPQYVTNVGIVNVRIKNAVRSPYFSAKSFHQTTPTQWLTERTNPAPWADFQSDKYMMQVPSSWIRAMPDPTELMKDWDIAADTCNDLMGFPHDRGKETMYDQVDLLLRGSAYFPGYPTGNNSYSPSGNYGGYASSYLVRGPQYAPDFHFHEHGHGFLFPKFPGETEAEVNLLHVAVWHQRFGYGLDEAFRKSRSGYPAYATLDTTAIAWMMCYNFVNGVPMEQVEKQYQLKGHAKFVDIARLFGWEKLNQYWYSFTSDYENNVARPTDVDSLLLRLSKNVGADMRPLFHFWGVPPVNNTTLGTNIVAANLPASSAIYDTLVHYKSLVPTNNAAFTNFAYNWWGKQPSTKGYTEERNHAEQWDTYDEASAAAVKARAQKIIDLYFPSGRPSDR